MARKGNQQRNGLNRNGPNYKNVVSEMVNKESLKSHDGKIAEEEPSSSPSQEGKNNTKGSGKKSKQRSAGVSCRGKSDDTNPNLSQTVDTSSKIRDPAGSDLSSGASGSRGNDEMFNSSNHNQKVSSNNVPEGVPVENMMENSGLSAAVAGKDVRALALYILKVASEWVEQQKPRFTTFAAVLRMGHDYVRLKVEHVCPIIFTWILYFGKLILLLSMVWLECGIRGLDSLLRLGTTSFFTVIWCSILSVIAMTGITKFLILMVIAALVAIFIGLGLAIVIISMFAIVILWLYGSFWTTGVVILIGGITFALSHERVALLITTIYSMHCARSYVGWLGLLLGLNLSFISSDILIHFLQNKLSEHRSNDPSEQARHSQGRSGHWYGEPFHSSQADDTSQSTSERSADRSTGVPSTSGPEAELTSEDEVLWLLNCTDHYSALGFNRYENIDVSVLKREYRKKAMLVHPDKNMGNEKAAEAFKKLQNAYEKEVLSLTVSATIDRVGLIRIEHAFYEGCNHQRVTYLSTDKLGFAVDLHLKPKFIYDNMKKGRHGIFRSGYGHAEAEDEGIYGESRRIACKKCSQFHVWACTERSKSRARWCQGMKCLANTHKPSFHVNTSLTKQPSSKATTSAHRGGGGMPTTNMDETMTEEEFFEWLQNAMQSGMFETSNMSNETPSPRNGGCSKSSVKKKRKGKKQW
ncbi:Chaperone protein DnaJ [Cocos nucifera]|uniref:Chaperone protein DnaJ n=1 Tax=Cocos nucifera TaxID=13894 RepID=A0A8K0HTZ8_COCNU|nr:Chaperone protein DnaJ [Cocos nucifera]